MKQDNQLKTLAFLLGFTCFIVQLVLIREFLNLFMGNELVIGIILALWMLLTATGAIAGRFLQKRNQGCLPIITLLILNGIFPLAGAFLAVGLRSMLYAPGMMINLQGVFLISAAGLFAFCFVSGMMFTILASAFSGTGQKNSISRIYAIEALGSLAGGIIFNFVLIYAFNSLHILSIIMILNLVAATWFAFKQRKTITGIICLALSIPIMTAAIHFDPDVCLTKMLYPKQEVLLYIDTPFGKLVVTEKAGQYNFFSSGKPFVISDDIAEKEEKVHYAMSLHPSPKHVLMLSGGLDGATEEVLKYDIEGLDYVDPDPWSMEAAEIYTGLKWPDGISIYKQDPYSFLKKTVQAYDVILLNTAPPDNVGNNRFYTDEFFHNIKSRLAEGGIFSIRLPGAGNYLHEETRLQYSTIYNTLSKNFPHIRLIPGNSTCFLASDRPLHASFTELIRNRAIPTEFVNEWYIDEEQMNERAALIMDELDPDTRTNTVFHPFASYLSVLQWLGMFNIPVWIIALIPILLMTIIILRLSPVNLGLFTTGFTASATEFLLLIAFQAAYGFIYQMAGLIIMVFMAGLAAGSGYLHRHIAESRKTFIRLQIIIGIFIGILPILLIPMYSLSHTWLPGIAICLFTFIVAALTGMQYRLATKLRHGSTASVASSTYSADLAGSAFGIFFIAVFMFPLLGMIYTGLILAYFNFMAAVVIRLRNRC